MSGRIRLVKGDDDTIRGDAVRDLTNELLGDLDASLALDRVEGDDFELATAVDAAQTSPFLTDRRVVVVRNLARFSADELAPLVAYLGDPLPTTDLILVWEKAPGSTARLNPVPKKLNEALAGAGGEVLDTSVGRNAKDWVNDQLAASTVNLDKGARDLVAAHLAGDLGRLAAVITTIEAAYGPGAKLDSDAVAPFLGEAGGIPPWDLTDAIDSGDIGLAIERVHRMLGAGTMHSLQVLAILTTHFRRILALEGADVRTEADAAARLGLKGKSTFPAKKALGRANRLGYDGSAQAVGLLAQADVDLRGKTAWPEELVLEVLVARLARLSR
ncbi:MAG TPA: DNA polymerase III subunit delta [Acidimicrobiales bacterium]